MKWKRIITGGISGAFYLPLRFAGRRKGYRVLLYHAVGSKLPHDSYGISIEAGLFAQHMTALKGMENISIVDFNRDNRSDIKLNIAITFDDGYKDNLYTAAPVLLKNHMPFTVFVTTSFVRNKAPLYLSPAELKELSSLEGVTIGSHGETHVPLGECNGAVLWKELYESRCYLEDLTGKPVTAISYPHGSVNRRVRDTAEKAGYIAGGCSIFGINSASQDPMMLYRTEIIAPDSKQILYKKIFGAYDWYKLYQKIL